MTNQEWLNLSKDLLRYNGRVGSGGRKFLKIISQDENALRIARSQFGDNGLYRASNKAIVDFLNNYQLGTLEKGGESKNAR